jgi:hypothetical protein
MMTPPPISKADLQRLVETLPPERHNPYAYLEDWTPDQLLLRRIELSAQLKTLEQERHAIDAELHEVYSDPELRHGIRAPGGWVLRSRSRTNWDYAPEVRDAINTLQQQAKRNGQAEPLVSSYLCLVQEI